MSLLDKLRDFIATQPDEPEDELGEDECPTGGEHDWQQVRAANAREPLFTFCRKCRQKLAKQSAS